MGDYGPNPPPLEVYDKLTGQWVLAAGPAVAAVAQHEAGIFSKAAGVVASHWFGGVIGAADWYLRSTAWPTTVVEDLGQIDDTAKALDEQRVPGDKCCEDFVFDMALNSTGLARPMTERESLALSVAFMFRGVSQPTETQVATAVAQVLRTSKSRGPKPRKESVMRRVLQLLESQGVSVRRVHVRDLFGPSSSRYRPSGYFRSQGGLPVL